MVMLTWSASPFQCLEVIFDTPSTVTRLLLVYRPPSTGRRGVSFRTFTAEFTNLLDFFTAQSTGLIILDDVNIHYGKAGNKDSNDFFDLLHALNLQQHVRPPAHTICNIQDLVITPSSGSVVKSVTVGSLFTDHHAVHCLLQAPKSDRTKKQVFFRKYTAINSTKFKSDFELSHLVTSPCNNIADLSQQYDSTLKGLLNSHAPLITRSVTVRPNTPWHSNELSLAKQKLRQAERKSRLTKPKIHRDIYTGQRETYKQQIQYAKCLAQSVRFPASPQPTFSL